MPKRRTWVIKLGGSLVGSAELSSWLAAIARLASCHRIVVVTGGGPFADCVRGTQRSLQVSDETAHTMALLAMRQFALAVVARLTHAGADLCTIAAVNGRVGNGVGVWDPADPALTDAALPRHWGVTSDALSLWLCGAINGSGLVLVKSRAPLAAVPDVANLAEEAYIDDYFPSLWMRSPQPVYWLRRSQAASLPMVLQRTDPAGIHAGAPTPDGTA